jgi:hypothetical protein
LNLSITKQGEMTMKRNTLLLLALLGVIMSASAWAHHAAEGIISDDIWTSIDDMLVESPHIELDFSDIMGSMRVDEAPSGGSMFLVSSVTMDIGDLDLYLEAIDTVMSALHQTNGDPNGNRNNNFLPMFADPVCDETECHISLYEPIGSTGWTDDPGEVYDPPGAPGPGKGKKG